jgi:hypothetical protein
LVVIISSHECESRFDDSTPLRHQPAKQGKE